MNPLPPDFGLRTLDLGLSKRRPAKLLRFGSVAIPYQEYRTARRRYWMLFYYQGGQRHRENRSTFAALKQRAEQLATSLNNGQTQMAQFTEADRARYLAVCENFARAGISPENGSAEYADMKTRLTQLQVSFDTVANYWSEHQAPGVVSRNIPDLVADLLAQKQVEKKGARWLRTLGQQLAAFAGHFTGPLHTVQASDLNAWLRSLGVGLRTRRNYRCAIRELVRHAQAENHLPRDWGELDHVDDPSVPLTDIQIYTPEQIATLLSTAHPNLVPLLALMSFAGIRHEEMSSPHKDALVTWRDIDLERGLIRVSGRAAKVKKQRLIKISANLKAWLTPHAIRHGPICSLKCTGDALTKLGARAGIPWKKNACRKSFITYRTAQTNDVALVAREAGNSPAQIESSYLELASAEEGARWFNVHPAAEKDILPLFAWAQTT